MVQRKVDGIQLVRIKVSTVDFSTRETIVDGHELKLTVPLVKIDGPRVLNWTGHLNSTQYRVVQEDQLSDHLFGPDFWSVQFDT